MTNRYTWATIYVCGAECGYSTEDVFVDCCVRCGTCLRVRNGRFEWHPHRVQWWRPATWSGGRWVFTGETRGAYE